MDDMSQKLMSMMNDPEIMSKIQGLSGLLSQGSNSVEEAPKPLKEEISQQPNDNFAFPSDMMGAMMKLMPLMNSFREDDETTRLLKALRPFLSEPRQKKLDEAIRLMRIMKLLPLLKNTDILSFFK